MKEFKPGTKVIIKGNCISSRLIGGLYSSPTPSFQFELFRRTFPISRGYWKDILKGVIEEVGNDNHYIIRDGNNYYVFSNHYGEMDEDPEEIENKSLKCIRSLITQSYINLSSEKKRHVSLKGVNSMGKQKLIKLYMKIKEVANHEEM